ncbi:intercompartmental signaling factor BofC [Aquibacillus koreensis]|uniref:Intercompartmental signaling factor BofC n=1 Tax=Aquibacillus koreensis TaxID=279446 RepID=A0A9X3WHM2_9BACI|nr:intercompartmental signaling factor BofC [Aquibacillus koreensis]MCT2537981.1 intercompartmental signaling factor BofC [Aquibacillus koreensis]MDC3419128.1 intercompartmental signaling factor BofC [Aquibacillus koreensis]
MKKHMFLFVLSVSIVFGGLGLSSLVQADDHVKKSVAVSQNKEDMVQQQSLEIQVTLQKHYIDGRVSEETHTETIGAMEDFWAYYHDWQVVTQEQGEIVFKKQVSDISPYLKDRGYFGLSDDILTIFDGKPGHEQVIQSFYQIDTSELESYQADQLNEGIKIDSKEVYEYVLEAYREMTPSKSVSS